MKKCLFRHFCLGVRSQNEERLRRRRDEEDRWELVASGVGGAGGTHVSDTIKCPQCSAQKVTVHNILSGGTYAQERVAIEKYVCKECSHTWRGDV